MSDGTRRHSYNRHMAVQLRRWMPALKILLTLVILAWVVWFFARILTSDELQKIDRTRAPAQILWDQACAARPGELLLAAAFYLFGLAFSALFWIGLLRVAGAALPISAGLRAYYVSQLGKYTPGMGLPTVIRMTLTAPAGVRPGTAALTAAYETLTTMAAGALIAALLISLKATTDFSFVWLALCLSALAVAPIFPGVFNPLVHRLSSRFTAGQPLPHLPAIALPIGLVLTACGWAFLGGSLFAVVRALQESPGPWNVFDFLDCTAVAALSVVAGFIGQMPGGAGIREVILQQFLAPRIGGDARALVAALLLRLLWTCAEIAAAGALFWLPIKRVIRLEPPLVKGESGP